MKECKTLESGVVHHRVKERPRLNINTSTGCSRKYTPTLKDNGEQEHSITRERPSHEPKCLKYLDHPHKHLMNTQIKPHPTNMEATKKVVKDKEKVETLSLL